MKIWLWFWLSCKRQLKRPAYLVLLILLPVLFYGAKGLERADQEGVQIGLYVEDKGVSKKIAELLKSQKGMFHFYECASEEELKADVASRKAECGYVFFSGLEGKLDRGRFKRSIGIYSAPSTVVAPLSSEVVFSALIEVYGRNLLKRYVVTEEIFEPMDRNLAWEEIERLFDKYYQNGSTFSFAYETMDSKPVETSSVKTGIKARGIAAVYIFIIGLFSAVTLCADEKKGLFIPVPYTSKIWCSLSAMLAPVVLASISGLLAIWISGEQRELWFEAVVMAGYAVLVVLFGYLLKTVVKNPAVICSTIPFFILGSLVLCPVFFDIGMFLPGLGNLGKCFLPYYYLDVFM